MSDSTMNKAINEASSGRPSQQQTYQPMTFDSIKIGLASPEKIRSWAHKVDLYPKFIYNLYINYNINSNGEIEEKRLK